MFQTKYLFFLLLWPLVPGSGLYKGMDKPVTPYTYTFKQPYKISLGPSYLPYPALKSNLTKTFFPKHFHNPLSLMAMQAAEEQATSQATGPFTTFVQYEAKDSITFDLQEKVFSLYGVGSIGYDNMQLEAENIALNWSTNTIIATGTQDETSKIQGKPTFIQDEVKYIAEEIRYNIDSKRGTARKLWTKQDEAIIHCNKAKMDAADTYYTDDLHYTTCNLVNPHYHVKARKVKFVQGKKVASGPFQFYFDNVPTPLGFFYGVFFMPQPKSSGILPPKLGEDAQKGFYMKDGGYYFYFNDYLDLALQGAMYSKGYASISAASNYQKRYAYTGHLSYEHSLNTQYDELALQKDQEKSWQFKWKHATQNNKVSSLSAEVAMQSQSFNKNTTTEDQIKATTNSSIKYTNNLIGLPYTLSTSLAHSKNFQTKVTHVTLPQIILTTGNIYPFKGKRKASKRWYQDIYGKHRFEFENKLTNVIGKDTLDISPKTLPRLFKEGKYGVKHTLPLATNIKLFQYFNLKPQFQYQERWYWQSIDYQYDAYQDTIIENRVPGFRRVWDYNWGTNLQTTLYGTHAFGPHAFVQAFRHQVEPLIGFNYTPDFSKEKFGYWQKLQTKQGEKLLDKFHDFVYGAPKNRASAVLKLALDNTLDIKVKNLANPTEKPKKVPILEAFNVGTNYDFLADSFKLSDITLTARTRVLDSLVSIEYKADFDPYIYKNKKRIEEFAWHHGQGIGYVKNSSLKISTSLKPPGNKDTPKQEDDLEDKQATQLLPPDPTQYVDFDVPWQLQLTFYRNYKYQVAKDQQEISKQLSFDGEVNLTKKWKIGFASTYDIDKKELVGSATKLSIYRDLHCWQMNFDWRPLGNKQSYEFSIGIKAPILQDIKYDRSNEYKKW